MTADIHTLAGAYALHALPSEERRFFMEHLAACEACREEVRELQATAARLGAAAYEPPPPGLRERVLAEIDVTRQEAPLVGRAPAPPPRWLGRVLVPVAAVLALLTIGLALLVGELNQRLDRLETLTAELVAILAAPDGRRVALETPEGTLAHFVYSPGEGRGVLVAEGLRPVPEDRAYALWLIDQEGPQPAGLFRPGADGRATELVVGDLASAQALGITIEPATGSLVPTGEVLIEGSLET
ncbi:MAG: anti-sigma factor [Acidimicrobiia bacterium]